MSLSLPADNRLFVEIKGLIQSARQRAAVSINQELTLVYWQVGKRISEEVLRGERAEYLTSLPPKEILEQRLHQAIINAKHRLENKR